MASKKPLIQGLSAQVPIVDSDGRPTAQFCQVLQKLAVTGALTKTASGAIDVGTGSISLSQIQNIATQMIIARKTAGTGSPEVCTMSDILDFLGTTRGSLLYRGASGWTILAPGTSGKVLQSNGAGADPSWVTPSAGGGGSSIFAINAPPFSSTTWMNQGTSTFTTNSDGSVTLVPQVVGSGNSVRGVFIPLAAGSYSKKIGFIPTMQSTGFQIYGIALRNSSSGSFILFGVYRDASTACLWAAMNFTTPTGSQTNVNIPSTPSNWTHAHPIYVNLADNGTTRTCTIGIEPWNAPFLNYSQPTGTFIAPDQIGIVAMNSGGSAGYGLTCFSWQ